MQSTNPCETAPAATSQPASSRNNVPADNPKTLDEAISMLAVAREELGQANHARATHEGTISAQQRRIDLLEGFVGAGGLPLAEAVPPLTVAVSDSTTDDWADRHAAAKSPSEQDRIIEEFQVAARAGKVRGASRESA